MKHLCALLLAILPCCLPVAQANATEPTQLNPTLGEQVISVAIPQKADDARSPMLRLQVTLFTPPDPGPHPVALFIHGKDPILPNLQHRERAEYVARYFLSRGYAVVMPMLRGFAGSEGRAWPDDCNVSMNTVLEAEDINQLIKSLTYHPEISHHALDMERVIVAGQSYGGWATLGVGALEIPGVTGLINFSGGVKASTCRHWEDQLVNAAEKLGRDTRTPSLWFYGSNDSLFSETLWHALDKSYRSAGGRPQVVNVGDFMEDSHQLIGKIEGLPIWTPKVDQFLESLNMPHTNLHPDLLPHPYPTATGYAKLDDVSALPLINDAGRDMYRKFLVSPKPRVFLIATTGGTTLLTQGYDPLEQGMQSCRQHQLRCQAYAIDDRVVWPLPMMRPTPTNFAKLDDVTAMPYVGPGGRAGYQKFLTLPAPRAFVIAPDGAWSLSARDFDVLASAMKACSASHQGCRAYAIDDMIVW